jgi:hypothetical protein
MLTIRNAQMKMFESQRDIRLAARLQEHLMEHYRGYAEFLPEAEVCGRILHGIQKAREFGLSNFRTIGDFVGRTFTVGPAFFEQKNIAAALARVASDPRPDTRFALIDLEVTIEDWQEAGSAADSGPSPVPEGSL